MVLSILVGRINHGAVIILRLIIGLIVAAWAVFSWYGGRILLLRPNVSLSMSINEILSIFKVSVPLSGEVSLTRNAWNISILIAGIPAPRVTFLSLCIRIIQYLLVWRRSVDGFEHHLLGIHIFTQISLHELLAAKFLLSTLGDLENGLALSVFVLRQRINDGVSICCIGAPESTLLGLV